jgi:alpha-amylase/alpha-mannosidase (GH57 family)
MSILVSFLWHMHQPFYKDLVRESYVMPWTYLHGTKDYYGMAALAEEFPNVHQTFNLVPSLLLQLEEYGRGEAQDASLELAFKPVDELTAEQRRQFEEFARKRPIPPGERRPFREGPNQFGQPPRDGNLQRPPRYEDDPLPPPVHRPPREP